MSDLPELPDWYRRRLAAAHQTHDWFKIEAKAKSREAKVYLYDVIGGWETSAKGFVDQVAALKVDTIKLHINSPGGNSYDGIAIYNTLRDHDARVVATVDGIAASAASIVAMAADEVVMAPGTEMMIHEPRALAIDVTADGLSSSLAS